MIIFLLIFFAKINYSKVVEHLGFKYIVVKEVIHIRRVLIKCISTNLMIVDLLTKGLPSKIFVGHVKCTNIMSVNNY